MNFVQKLLNAQITYTKLHYQSNSELLKHFNKVALKVFLNGLKNPLGSLMRTKDPEDLDTARNLLTNVYQMEISAHNVTRPLTLARANPVQKMAQPFTARQIQPSTTQL